MSQFRPVKAGQAADAHHFVVVEATDDERLRKALTHSLERQTALIFERHSELQGVKSESLQAESLLGGYVRWREPPDPPS